LTSYAPSRPEPADSSGPTAELSIRLDRDDVHVWLVDLAAVKADVTVLTTEELVRARRFRFARDRDAFLASRTVRRELVSRYTGLPAARLQFDRGPAGQPCVAGVDWLHLSHARSGAYAVFAVARTAIGVDLEVVRQFPEWTIVSDRFFSAAEHRRLRSLSAADAERAFLRCWTVKEAYLKATGVGIATGLAAVETGLDHEGSVGLVAIDGHPQEAARWEVRQLDVADWPAIASLVLPGPAPVSRWTVSVRPGFPRSTLGSH
jgi:4'-phosphopantetheinyl transferase